jgi:hypothetical protein
VLFKNSNCFREHRNGELKACFLCLFYKYFPPNSSLSSLQKLSPTYAVYKETRKLGSATASMTLIWRVYPYPVRDI